VTDYTAAEIEAAAELLGDDWETLQYAGRYSTDDTIVLRGEPVKIEHVAGAGGEGEGDSIWFVTKVGDQLFRKDGYYASHYGTDWDGDFREVQAVEKTVIVYE
jgi:hypothetical protein